MGRLLLFLGFLIATGLNSYAQGPVAVEHASTLEQALNEYSSALEIKDRDSRLAAFSRSEQLFSQIIEGQLEAGEKPNAELLFNLGNAALQAEHVGHAVLAFRRALAVNANMSRARQNLEYARSALPEWAQPEMESELIDTLFFWNYFFTRQQISLAAAVLFCAAAFLLAGGIYTGRGLLRNLASIPVLLWLVLLASQWMHDQPLESEAVVTADQAVLYSADSENSAPRMPQPLPAGAEVVVLQQRERWTEIQFRARTGWLRSSAISIVELKPQAPVIR